MWVWQSQAPAGTSKFTGVEGCAAVAKADLSDMVIPAAMEASRILRRVSMAFLPVASLRPDFALARRVADYRVGARSSAVALAGISLGHRQAWMVGLEALLTRRREWNHGTVVVAQFVLAKTGLAQGPAGMDCARGSKRRQPQPGW